MSSPSSDYSDYIKDYELLELIGVGSFGDVYRAICRTNNKLCAVKCIAKKSSRGHGAPNISKVIKSQKFSLNLVVSSHTDLC